MAAPKDAHLTFVIDVTIPSASLNNETAGSTLGNLASVVTGQSLQAVYAAFPDATADADTVISGGFSSALPDLPA